jgi:prevent-host-death family protein
MRITRDIQSLSDFKQNASKLVRQIQQTKEPIIVTVNGKAAVVVQDAESYQTMIDARERAESAAVLRERLEYVKAGGKLVAADDVFDRISSKYGISFTD